MNIKKIFILLTIIILCFTIYKIVSTYALFETQLQKNVKADVGKWNIKVNAEDITNTTTHSFTMNTFKISQSPYTKENKIQFSVLFVERQLQRIQMTLLLITVYLLILLLVLIVIKR